ncbi:unnamed protein product [Haemonchus placei]|uniref:Serpentine receptor class gamma n=1 Tax=Haemonchus placei TaxID=6290 RepID=A0A0N4WEU0_HAEPC|nr:unnamed protein product [Haemonchus placei]
MLPVLLYIRLAYCIPSIVLYVVVMFLISKDRQRLFGSFYSLLIIQAVTDVPAIWFQLYIFLAVMILASSSVSVISLASLWIRRKGSRHNRLERNLFMLALGDFLVEIVLFLLMTIVYKDQIIVDHDETISLIVLPFALDLKSLSTPYLIVVLNESVRTRLLRRLKLHKQVVPARNSVLRRGMARSSPTPDRIFRVSTGATARSTTSPARNMIPLLYIRMVYCIPSIIFYVMVMCWIFKDRRRLFGSFFYLLVMQAVTNFIVFIDNVYLIQLADETDEETWWRVIYTGSPQALTRIFAFMGIHFAFVQAYVTLLISVNRMTVIVWSAKGEQTIVYMDQPDDDDDERIALALVPFAIDLMTLSTPYLLIAFNQSLRTRMIHSTDSFSGADHEAITVYGFRKRLSPRSCLHSNVMSLFYIRLAYCIPSIVLYIVVIWAISKEKQRLFGSFYSLLVIQAITNLLVYVNSFYFLQLANETEDYRWWAVIYTEAPQALMRITSWLGMHFAFVQTYITFFISLNRMAAIVWPRMNDRIWSVVVVLSTIISYVSPLIATYPYLTEEASFVYSKTIEGYVAHSNSCRYLKEMTIFYIRLGYCIPSIVLYVVVIYAVSKEKQRLFGSFYSLLIIQAVTNLLVYVNSFYVLQLANETEKDSWWAVIYTKAPQALIRVCRHSIVMIIFFYIRLAYCIPSIILYIVVIYAISKEKQRLFGSFYSLLVIQAVTNLLVYVNSFYFLQLANETEDYRWWAVIYTKAPQALMRITSWLGMHFAFVQTYITFFISLNRMAAIVWPRMDDRIWSAVVVLSTVISYVSPLIATYPYLTEEASFVYSKTLEGFVAFSDSTILQIDRGGDFEKNARLTLIPFTSDLMTFSMPYLVLFLNKSVRTHKPAMYEYRIYVRFIYCIPSCVLYVYVLIALFKERKGAAGQFYSLLMVQALLLHCFKVHFAFVQNYMSFFVSLYRMTVIVFPTTYVTIWNYGFPASVAITLLTPFISVYPLLTHSSHFVISKSTDCFDVISTAAIIYKRADKHGTADFLVPYASDVITFSNAYLLIILNKKIRRHVLLMAKCRGKGYMYEYRVYVRFIYCIPSCVLYVYVLIALFKERKTDKGRFYSLLMFQAVLNVLVFANSFYVIQLANVTNEDSWWSGIYNREPLYFTGFIWRFAFPGSVAVTVLTPFLSVYPLVISPSWFFIDRSTLCFDIATENSMAIIYNRAEKDSVTEYLVPYASDVVTFSNAYLLVVLNKKIRQRVLLLVKCRATSPKVAVLVNPGPTYSGVVTIARSTSIFSVCHNMYEYRVYIRFVYCIPSCILYVYVLVALFKERKGDKGRFYSLLMVQAVLNVFVFLNSFYVTQLANVTNEDSWWSGIYNREPLYFTGFLNCLTFHFAFAQTFMMFFVSFYRMTIISFPIHHLKIWKFAFPGSVAVTVFTPFLSVYPLVVSPSWFFIDRSTHCFDIATENSMSKYYIMRELYIFLTVFLIATSLVNCVSVILFCIRSKRHNDNAERNMFILALLDFLFQLTFYILFAIIYNRAEKDSVTEYLVPYASDVVTFSNAYLLILLNKKIRQRVLLLVKCRGTAPKTTVLVNTRPTYTGVATVTRVTSIFSVHLDMYEYRVYIRLIYCIPSCILYVYVLIALFKERKGVKGRFYSLLMFQAILNVLVFVNSLYLIQLANMTREDSWWSGIYSKEPLLFTGILNCLSIHFAFVQSYMTFFVSLYRTTVIAFPVLHVKLWKYFFPCCVAITLLTPFIFVHPMLTKYSYYSISKFNNYDVQTLANRGLILTQFLVFMTASLVTTSAVNGISVILLCIRSKRTDDKAERNMFILAILDFFVQCSFYVLYVMIYKRVGIDGTADVIVPYASDLLTFSNAYLLLVLNKKIRRRVFLLMKCRGSAVTPHNLQAIPSANIITAVQPTS